MVAVVSGSGLGLFNSSILGGNGGRGPDRVYVNTNTGNLVIQSGDEHVVSAGADFSLIRTYNSQGQFDDDNGDNWRLSGHVLLKNQAGTLNAAGSTITKVFGDGAEVVYTYDEARNCYVSTDGDGAHDTLAWNTGTSKWLWTDGSEGNQETFDASGRLTNTADRYGFGSTFHYNGDLLTEIWDASGQKTYLDYVGDNLSRVRVVSQGNEQTITRYEYDSLNRLTTVLFDLSPNDNSIADGGVYVTTYTYDGTSRRVASLSQGDNTGVHTVGSFTYELIGGVYRLKTYTDGAQRVTTYDYTVHTGGGTVSANPAALSTTETTLEEVTVPPYTYVQPGDTWDSLAARIYGDPSYGAALKAALGSPTLAAAQRFTNLPAVLVDSANGATYIRGGTALNTSPVTACHEDGSGRVFATEHANGTVTTFTYDASSGNLIEQRIHGALDPTTTAWQNDFDVDSSGFGAFDPSWLSSVGDGAWIVKSAAYNGPSSDSFSTATYNYDSHYTYRAELSFGDELLGGYFAFGLLNTDQTRGLTALFNLSNLSTTVKQDTWSTHALGLIGANRTYVVEIETSATGSTLWIYQKGTPRNAGFQYHTSATDWGDLKMFVETSPSPITHETSVRVENISVAGATGLLVGNRIVTDSASDIVASVSASSSAFATRYGDSWSSIAATLYGSSAAGNELQAALGSPTLVNPQRLSNIPTTLSASTLPSTPRVLNTSGGSSSPVVNTYFDGDGRISGTLHADGTITSYSYDGHGNLVERRHHTAAATFPIALQDFTHDSAGVSSLPAWFLTHENGQLTATLNYGPEDAFFGLVNFADHPVFRGEVTTSTDLLSGYIALGVLSSDHTRRVFDAVFRPDGTVHAINKDQAYADTLLGTFSPGATYVVELATSATGVTLYVYKKGTSRAAAMTATSSFTDWGDMEMFFELAASAGPPFATAGLDNFSITPALGRIVGTRFVADSPTDTVNALDLDGVSYVVQSGNSWSSIALALYGSSAVADELAATLGNPTLTAGLVLSNLPQILVDEDAVANVGRGVIPSAVSTIDQHEVPHTVPAYYVVPSGATWASVTQAIYGTSDPNFVSALRARTGSPVLAEGLHLTVPTTLSYATAAANSSALSTTEQQTIITPHPLNTTQLTFPSGNTWTPDTLLESSSTFVGKPRIAYDANGNGFAVWADELGPTGTVHIRRYTRATATWGPEQVVTGDFGYSSSSVRSLSLAVDAGGNAVLAWQLRRNPAYFFDSAIRSMCFDNATGTWSSVVQFNDETLSGANNTLSVAINGSHAVVLAGIRTASASAGPVRMFAAELTNGNVTGVGQYIDTGVGGAGIYPSVAIDDEGNATAVWYQSEADGTTLHAYTNRFDAATNTWCTPTLLDSSPAATVATSIQVRFDCDGNAMAMWGQDNDVRVRRFDKASGTWGAITTINSAADDLAWMSLAVDASGNAVAAWQQLDGSVPVVYANHYDAIQGTWGGPQLLDTGKYVIAPISSAISGGRAVVGWAQTDGSTTSNITVARYSGGWSALQRFDASGGHFIDASVTIDAEGSVGAVWSSPGPGENAFGASLHTSRFTAPSGAPYYVVPSGATWASIAQTLYGTSAVSGQLQTALGNPTLTPGVHLTSLPSTLSTSSIEVVTVAPYYAVPSGATWQSVAQAIYGSADSRLITALQIFTGSPALTAGLHLTVPTNLAYNVSLFGALETVITDALGNKTTLLHDGLGRLISVKGPQTSAGASETRYEYDADGNVTSVIQDPEGLPRTSTFRHDSHGNVIFERDAAGNTVERVYSDTNRVLNEIRYAAADLDGDGPGEPSLPRVTRYVYDTADRLRFVISDEGRVIEYGYDPIGQLRVQLRYTTGRYVTDSATGLYDPLDLAHLLGWKGSQDLTKVEHTAYEYNFRGQLAIVRQYRETDSQGFAVPGTDIVTRYTYDQRGRLLETITPRGQATGDTSDYRTAYTYDGLGRQLTSTEWMTDSSIRSITTHYDDHNNTVTTEMSGGLVRTSVYNAAGDLLSVANTDLANHNLGTTSYAYDGAGRLRMVTDPLLQRTHTFYDSAGRVSATVDADGSLTELTYDNLGRLVKATAYADRLRPTTLSSLVDGQGAPVATDVVALVASLATIEGRNPLNDAVSRIVYDGAGRVVFTISATGSVKQTVYDGVGKVTDEIAYANLAILDHALGALEPDDVVVIASADNDRRTRYQYSADGQLATMLDAGGFLTDYLYDTAGRLVRTIRWANEARAEGRATDALENLFSGTDNEIAIDPEVDESTFYFYDKLGRQVGVVDPKGYLTENVYDDDGNLTHTIRYDQALTVLSDSTLASLKQAVLPATRSRGTSYEYDGEGKVVRKTEYEGTVTEFEFDDAGNLISTTRAVGTNEARQTQARYDALGRVVAELTAEGSAHLTPTSTNAEIEAAWAQYAVHYAYDVAGRRISATDQLGHRTLYYYDADGRQTHVVNAEGEVSEVLYDALGRVSGTRTYNEDINTAGLVGGRLTSDFTSQLNTNDLLNGSTTTSYAFTSTGEVTTRSTAEGSVVASRVNAFGNEVERVEKVDSTRNRRHTYTYNTRGLLETTVWEDPVDGRSETRRYNAFGELTKITNQDNQVQQFEYDAIGQQTATVDALGQRRTTSYDAFGRVTSTQDAFHFSTIYDYVDGERRVTVTTPQGVSVVTVYNRHGQTLSLTDGRGTTTHYTYDDNGQLESVSDNAGPLEDRLYDVAGRLTDSTDANRVKTHFEYDAANRALTQIVDTSSNGLALTTHYVYDEQGRLHQVTSPNGILTRTEYDKDGRVKSVTVDPDGSNLSQTSYDYDFAGDLVLKTEGAGSLKPRRTQYVYDTLGQRVEEIVDPMSLGGSGALNIRTQYRYDANGNVVRKIIGDGNGDIQSTWYVYDAGHRLRYVIDSLGGVTENAYDAENRLQSTSRYANPVPPPLSQDRVLDSEASGWVTAAGNDPQHPARREQYVYDPTVRRSFIITDVGVSNVDPARVVELRYDQNGNVVERRTFSRSIAFGTYTTVQQVTDALTTAGNNVSPDYNADDAFEYTMYDERNRAIFSSDAELGLTRREYDGNGNVIRETRFAQRAAATGSLQDLLALANSVNANNRVTRYWYDASNRQRFVLDAEDYLTETRYNDSTRETVQTTYMHKPAAIGEGALLENVRNAVVTDAQDRSTTTVYDTAGRVYRVYDSYSQYEQFGYDAVGNKTSYQNKLGFKWDYDYDAAGRLILEHTPVVSVFTSTDGAAVGVSDVVQSSIVTYVQYDALGNVRHRTEAYGTVQARTTSYEYDKLGRQIRTIYPTVGYYSANPDADAATAAANISRASVETTGQLESRVFYDTIGNAVRSIDIAGNVSYKAYDRLGHVVYDVDAKNQVTYHHYDTLGNEVQLVRFDKPLISSLSANANEITRDAVLTRIVGSVLDRTITKTYDKMGRATSVSLPAVASYLAPSSGTGSLQEYTVGKTTTFEYNAFGELVRQTDRNTSSVSGLNDQSATVYYYDHLGQKTAEVNALGHITKTTYDAAGNVTRNVEYAKPIAVWDLVSHDEPVATTLSTSLDDPLGYDRNTAYEYDRLNRVVNERLEGFEYTQFIGGTRFTFNGFQLTAYEYDWTGNVVRTTVNGATTRSYYDALGRLIAVTEPPRDRGDGTTITPLTVMKRDAFGNVVEQIRYANTPSALTAGSFTAVSVRDGISETLSLSNGLFTRSASGASESQYYQDRITRFAYDSFSHVIHTEDATGADHYASYDKAGHVAKEWQFVTNNDNATEALVTVYVYDELGRQKAVIETQSFGDHNSSNGTYDDNDVIIKRETEYNAFGEVTVNRTVGGAEETFQYDNAGRMWRTNSGDGTYKVYLYDVAGNSTAEIKGLTVSLGGYQNAGQVNALALGQVTRTVSLYDRLERLVERRQPSFTSAGSLVTPTVHQVLDRWGRAIEVLDAAGFTTNYRYNQLGQIVEVKYPNMTLQNTTLDASGETGTYTGPVTMRPVERNFYDASGRLVGKQDGNGNVNRLTYNSASQVIREDHADGSRRLMAYNAFGDLIQTTEFATLDANDPGYRTRNGYDKVGRLVQTARELDTLRLNQADAVVFKFSLTDDFIVTYVYTYDEAGRRTSETNGAMAGFSTTAQETTRYWYDLQGNLIRRKLQANAPVDPDHSTFYTYDPYGLGKKTREQDANGNVQTWTYDGFGVLHAHTDLSNKLYTYNYNSITGSMTSQTSEWGQNISYTYNDEAGHLTLIQDRGLAASGILGLDSIVRDTEYKYDSSGRQSGEKITVDSVVHQDTTTQFDARGNIATVNDPRYSLSYSYDAAGNRTHIHSTYREVTGSSTSQDLWYAYDKMNRVDISQGALSGTTIQITASQGVDLSYDARGLRKTAKSNGAMLHERTVDGVTTYERAFGLNTETYGYDGIGNLTTIQREKLVSSFFTNGPIDSHTETYLSSKRTYDHASRELTEEYDSELPSTPADAPLAKHLRTSTYNDDGTLRTQTTTKSGVNEFDLLYDTYDAAGILHSYALTVYNSAGASQYFARHDLYYRPTDTYTQITHYVENHKSNPNDTSFQLPPTGTVSLVYNVNHEATAVLDNRDQNKNRYFVNNQAGQAITTALGLFDGLAGRLTAAQALSSAVTHASTGNGTNIKSTLNLFAQGEQMGSLENTGTAVRPHFDVNLTPVSDTYPDRAPSQVIVQEGDTLRSIATRVYGDGNLWYILAEENGITAGPDVVQTTGEVLRVPNDIVSLSNSGSIYKPFDAQAALGDTSPTQPMPPAPRANRHCGILGMIIVIVVAIIVTYATKGATTEFFAKFLGATAAKVAGVASAAAVGSAVSQEVGIAIGVQDSFSWKSVGLAAVSAGVAKGIGLSGFGAQFAEEGSYAAAAINGAAGNILTQGIAVLTGLQDDFSWREVAIATASAVAGHAVTESLSGPLASLADATNAGIAGFTRDVATGLTSMAVRAALGGKMETAYVLADVFLNAIGNSIADSLSSLPTSGNTFGASDTSTMGGDSSFPVTSAAAADNPSLSDDQAGAIYQPANIPSPGEAAAAANGAEPIPEVLISTDDWSFGEELEFWRMLMPRSQSRVDGRSGGGMAGYSMDAVAERARWNVQHDVRLDYQNPAQLNAQGQDLRMLRLLSPVNQFGLGESILTAASGFGSTVVAGFADLVTGDPGFGQYLQEEWTYQPRTEIGRDVLSTFGAAASPLVSGLEYSRGGLGDFGYSLTGSPTVAAAFYTAPDAALTLLAPESRLAFGSVGRGLFDGSTAVARYFGENLFNGPRPGSLAAQRGAIDLSVFGLRAIDISRVYEAQIRDSYGPVTWAQRQYQSFVDGEWRGGVADNVTTIDGRITAIEAKYVDDWAESLRNPASPIGMKEFAVKEQRAVLMQARQYSGAFDQVVYHSNSLDFISHYGKVFQDAGLTNVKFVHTPLKR